MIISFLASPRGPLQPTPKLSFQDIKIGIPSVILVMEMFLFSILHIFAYPWKPYSLAQNPAALESEDYQGGSFGVKAFVDAFNPWDIVKASARGARWMFVGVRKRHLDESYQAAKLGPDDASTGYMGATYAMSGDVSANPRHGRAGTKEEDRAGLLMDAQAPGSVPRTTGPYHPLTTEFQTADDEGHIDLGISRQKDSSLWAAAGGRDWKVSDRQHGNSDDDDDDDDEDEGVLGGGGVGVFHPGMGPPPGTGLAVGANGSVHPAMRGHRVDLPAGGGWDHWGGVQRGLEDERR